MYRRLYLLDARARSLSRSLLWRITNNLKPAKAGGGVANPPHCARYNIFYKKELAG